MDPTAVPGSFGVGKRGGAEGGRQISITDNQIEFFSILLCFPHASSSVNRNHVVSPESKRMRMRERERERERDYGRNGIVGCKRDG
jgi:hypothetical protein